MDPPGSATDDSANDDNGSTKPITNKSTKSAGTADDVGGDVVAEPSTIIASSNNNNDNEAVTPAAAIAAAIATQSSTNNGSSVRVGGRVGGGGARSRVGLGHFKRSVASAVESDSNAGANGAATPKFGLVQARPGLGRPTSMTSRASLGLAQVRHTPFGGFCFGHVVLCVRACDGCCKCFLITFVLRGSLPVRCLPQVVAATPAAVAKQ